MGLWQLKLKRLAHYFACLVASFESNFVAKSGCFYSCHSIANNVSRAQLYIGHFCLQFDVTKSHYTSNTQQQEACGSGGVAGGPADVALPQKSLKSAEQTALSARLCVFLLDPSQL
jgi:hypothetical protein